MTTSRRQQAARPAAATPEGMRGLRTPAAPHAAAAAARRSVLLLLAAAGEGRDLSGGGRRSGHVPPGGGITREKSEPAVTSRQRENNATAVGRMRGGSWVCVGVRMGVKNLAARRGILATIFSSQRVR